jgi:transcriptional regulator with XRE-family HTH domain
MHCLSKNIKYLRTRKSISQRQLASQVKVSISTIRSVEKGNSLPRLTTLQKLAEAFNYPLDTLLRTDLKREDTRIPENLNGSQIRVLPIMVHEESQQEKVSLVPVKAVAGYVRGLADTTFIAGLEHFAMPFPELSAERTYRVFQIEGESMLPVLPGSYIICEYLQDWALIRPGNLYVVVTRDDGIVYKRLYPGKEKHLLEFHSDNPEFDPYTLELSNILEIWPARGYVSFTFPPQPGRQG